MVILCWAAKGGSGTTVVAATLAVSSPAPVLLVDLAGDLPIALGVPTPDGPGIGEWSVSAASPGRLEALTVPLSVDLDLLPRGHRPASGRWSELADHLASVRRTVVVDAGTGPPPPELRRRADRVLLVTRACYLSVRKAVATGEPVDGIVLVEEPGRSLGIADIEASIGAPVVARVLLDPAVARAVDAGLLLARLPGAFRRGVADAA